MSPLPPKATAKASRLIVAPSQSRWGIVSWKTSRLKGSTPTDGFAALMSALGHKRTCAPQKPMSALPPIATAKADTRKRSCPLYPRKRTLAVHSRMSALGQKRTHAPQQTASLFDHLVDTGEQRGRHFEAKRVRGFEIDHQLEFGWLLDRQVGRLGALENFS